MVIETYENKEIGMKSHVIMMRLNGKIHFGVDIFNTIERQFIPHVEIFKKHEKATRYAKICVA